MYSVDTDELIGTAQAFDDCGYSLIQVGQRIRVITGKQFMSSRYYRNVSSALNNAAKRSEHQASDTQAMAKAVRSISTAYATADHESASDAKNKLSSITIKNSKKEESSKKDTSQNNIIDNLKDLRDLAKLFDKAKLLGNDSKVPSDIASFLSYLVSLVSMFDKEHWNDNGLKEFIDLCKDSGGLWKQLYDHVIKQSGLQGINGSGLFSLATQKGVAVSGVFTSMLGLASSIVDLSTKSFDSTLDKINQYITGIGTNAASVGKSIYDVKNLASLIGGESKAAFAAKGTGATSALMLVNGGIAIVTQSARSFDKYVMADGNMSLDDFARMGVEISVSGLYYAFFGSIIESLTDVSGEDLSQDLLNAVESKFRR